MKNAAAGVALGTAPTKSRHAKRKRSSYNMQEHYAYGEIAVAFRRGWHAKHGTMRGWATSFLAERFEGETLDDEAARAAAKELHAAVRLVDRRPKVVAGRKGVRLLAHTSRKRLHHRKRCNGGGRKPVCCAVSDELWAMFVDHIHNVPGRVGSSTIISWARMLCDDMRELWQRRVEAGEADPAAPPLSCHSSTTCSS